jgi:two-component system chemotaxis response regulator CheB
MSRGGFPMIRVLIVEDSPVVQQFLEHVLSSDPAVEVIGIARDGEEAIEMAKQRIPHVITMDINMPRMNGFEATRKIMESCPTPIIVVSASWDAREVETSFRAMEAGAVAILAKPRGGDHPELEPEARELIQTVKLMSEVKVVKRWMRKETAAVDARAPKIKAEKTHSGIEAVAIGASTGGPVPIQTILSAFPTQFPAPVFVVQHIASGFVSGFAEWLSGSSRLQVKVAVDGEHIDAGHVYVAPDEFHMGVRNDRRIALNREEPENGLRPSVSHLFRSVAHVYGGNSVGILLSGMGKDGAEELKLMRDRGAITFAQDEGTSVVYGMPGEAVKLGAAQYSLPPESIAATLANMAGAAAIGKEGLS